MFTQEVKNSGVDVKTQNITTFSCGQYSIMEEQIRNAERNESRTYLYVEGRKIELTYEELKELETLLKVYCSIPR